ncbi:craniofacial development protein 2-like [Penaeus monodon]|uniref:craniofacial development protein 2-like n=1 Tax=Penaeus monodon TaxID=6687 RepID=UPI0018A72B08|nr:craniofacial development protein 2-like [Penaeus monodon]
MVTWSGEDLSKTTAEHNHHYQCGTASFGEEIGPTNRICAFCNTHGMTTEINLIQDRSGPGISFGPSREGSVKYATGDETSERNVTKVETVIGTWNVRSLSQCGKAELLVHEMDNLNWHILGISQMRWEGTVNERLAMIRIAGKPFNLTVVQVYAPTQDCCDEVIDDFYENLNDLIKTIPRKDILVVQGDWNAKIGEDAYENWKDGKTHNQIDFILISKRFFIKIEQKQEPSTNLTIGSDHDLVMMPLKIKLKISKKTTTDRTRLI